MSALPPIADICGANRNVCFVPIADIRFISDEMIDFVLEQRTCASGVSWSGRYPIFLVGLAECRSDMRPLRERLRANSLLKLIREGAPPHPDLPKVRGF